MENKKIIIPNKISISLVIIKNVKFITIKNDIETKYVSLPSSVQLKKAENNLILVNKDLNVEKRAAYNQFVNTLQFAIKNLSTSFKKKIFLKGLGFRTNILDDLGIVEFKLGFSHLIRMKIPQDIKMKTRKSFIHIEGKDNVSLGNFVNKIIYLKYPDSYKGKEFWYK